MANNSDDAQAQAQIQTSDAANIQIVNKKREERKQDGKNEQKVKREDSVNPFLSGTELKNDDGPLLSVFALQEILDKIRESQLRGQIAGQEIETAAPDIKNLLNKILALKDIRGYKILKKPPVSYRYISAQSESRLFRVNNFKERVSVIGENAKCEDPIEFLNVILERVKFIRDEGSFILHDVSTQYLNGEEVVMSDCLGIDTANMFTSLNPMNRNDLQNQLNSFLVMNQTNDRPLMDIYNGACDDALYKVHSTLMNYIETGQTAAFRESLTWLKAYSHYKGIMYDQSYLTDIFSSESIYCLSYTLPTNPKVIWEVPRSSISNLVLNAALGFPTGIYISPPARIASVTITSRITTNTAFAQLQSMVPTEAVMADVRKIYFALCYPNQVVLDIRPEPGHQIDPVIQAVSGIFGKLLFSYGPRLFNITRTMAQLLDRGTANFLQMLTDGRRTIIRGQTGEPLDFVVSQGGRQFDCNQLANDPNTGRGFTSSRVDSVGVRVTPYDHVSRRICYLGYDSEEVLDERYTGSTYTFYLHDLLMEALIRTGHVTEKNYLEAIKQHNVVRFAYINQIINRDLLSAFSMPDDQFREMADRVPNNVFGPEGPIVLDVSYLSIWFAFKLRFLPTDRPALMIQQPLLESVYASHLSMMKLATKRLKQFVDANPDNFTTLKAMDIWKVVLKEIPEPLRDIIDLVGQKHFMSMGDIAIWVNSDQKQDSLLYHCDEVAWQCLDTPNDLMFIKDVYVHSQNIPEPIIDDLDTFKREAFYYTNMSDSLPPHDRIVYLSRGSMLVKAGEGKLKSAIRQMLDAGDYIRIGCSLRPLVIRFFESMPPQEIREALPFVYSVDEKKGPMPQITVRLENKVLGYVLIYNVTRDYLPDQYVSYLPAKNLTEVIVNPRVFERVEVNNALDVTFRVFQSYRSKVRLVDLTDSLQAGTQLASLASTEA
uniref:VP2 n=1 Tax=Middle Point orbivirus TaxID=464979 RepID=A0A8K1I309_9REOV|nr:VP2 [Middle Point orbivirus]